METKNFAIGVLSVTAVVLLVGLLVIHARPEPAYGAGMVTAGGDYVLVVGKVSQTEEILYVIDGAAQKLGVYAFDPTGPRMSLVDGQELAKMREQADKVAPKQPANPPPKGGRGTPPKKP